MSQPHDTLTGPWMGRYDYAKGGGKPVAFNALVRDEGGALSGDTMEPNTFAHLTLEADQLIAGIIGVREGRAVRFTKRYSDFDGPRLEYEGTLDGAFTRIEGKWWFPDTPQFAGTFVMIRDAVTVGAKREAAKTAKDSLTLLLDRTQR